MSIRKTTAALAVGTLIALGGLGVASAAPKDAQPAATQATCDALQKQADTATSTHKADPRAKAAQEQRDLGTKACKAGQYAAGAEHLRRAITDLGMKPVN